MKKRILSQVIILIGALLLLSSCAILNLGGGTGEQKEPENLIYNKNSELYLLCDPSVESDYVDQIGSEIDYNRNKVTSYVAVNSEKHEHEIVIGNTDREITKTALSRIERVNKNSEDEFVFLIYSDGSSVAVVWENCPEDGAAMAEVALKYFVENYCKDELIAEAGVLYSESVDIVEDYYRPLDEANREAVWAEFEKKYGKELADSFRALYAIYSPGAITWLANLYDPDICVCVDCYGEAECSGTKYCGTGAFYYSNSGRDTLGYLPDVESTNQALNFLTSSGLGYDYTKIITEDMKKQIGDFVYALEEPNGYFYHPQWGIEFTDARLTRRGRDLSWSCSILKNLGRTPKYTTASGMKGEDVIGTASSLTSRLGSSTLAVSKVISAAGAYDPILEDLDSFKKYLAGKDLRNNSYGVGSEIGTLVSQIKERDKALAAEGKPTIAPYLIEWLNAGQNPETGHWDYKKPGDDGYRDYHGTNGLLKISGIYIELGVQMPYAMEAAKSAMADIINPAEISQVVDLYNTWFSIKNITNNLESCGGAEGKALADEIRAELRKSAPEGILVSRDKISAFLKPDGSASYLKNQSSPNNQGCPSAVPGTNEGDVNGATIAINGIIGNVASALGVSKPALFGKAEKYLFLTTVKNLSPIVKTNDSVKPEPFDFEYDKIGSAPEDITLLLGSGSATVEKDPTERADGQLLEISSPKNSGDAVKLSVQNSSGLAKSFVFEGDFFVESAESDYLLQLTLDACYMITFRQVVDKDDPDYGRIRLVESSSATSQNSIDRYLGVTVDKGKWFRLKMEYYYGDDATVRIKVYVDTDLSDGNGYKLCAVSDNYRDEAGNKVFSSSGTPSRSTYVSQIYLMRSASVNMYADNLACYVSKDAYSTILGKDDDPYFNIDTPDKPEIKYGFDDGRLPEGFTLDCEDGSVAVSGGAVGIVGGSDKISRLTLPVTVTEANAKCASVSFEVNVSAAESGKEILLLNGMDGKYEIFGIALKCIERSGAKYIALCPRNESSVDSSAAEIPVGQTARITLDYYHREDVVLIYVDGEFLGATVKLYAEGNRRVMDSLRISTVKNVACELTIDNVTASMTSALLSDAIAPDADSEKLYDFESEHGDLTVTGKGATVGAHDGDKALIMDSSSAKTTLKAPVNVRAEVINSVSYSVRLDFTKLSEIGDIHKISFADKNGEILLAYILSYDGKNVALYEVGVGGKTEHPFFTFDAKSGASLELEIFYGADMVHLIKDHKVVARSSIFASENYREAGFATVTLESLTAKSTVAIDDLKCEAAYKIYKVVKPTSINNPETDLNAGLTFDKSSSGNLPAPVFTLTYGDNNLAVRNVYNDITKKYSNSLVLDKIGAGNDEIAFSSGMDTSALSAVAFEADIKMDLTSAGYAFRMSFGADKKGKDAMYMLQINRPSSGDLIFTDVSSSADSALKNDYNPHIKSGEWFRLRVEFFAGNRDTVKFKVYVNGSLICESSNFVGSHDPSKAPASLPSAAAFYFLGATRGSVYFDNVSITPLAD